MATRPANYMEYSSKVL